METNFKRQVVINDLLSFLLSKFETYTKDKLLSCIRDHYSHYDILEARKMLISSLPIKRATRHGRRVKHPDNLIAIYDCIKLIPIEDLPSFVYKNLNNAPENLKHNDDMKTKSYLLQNQQADYDKTIYDKQLVAKRKQEMDSGNIYLTEQKEMKRKLSELVSMITELKEDLTNVSDDKKVFSKKFKTMIESNKTEDGSQMTTNLSALALRKRAIEMDEDEEMVEFSVQKFENESGAGISLDEDSQLDSLALLQKYIDEDNDSKENFVEGECVSNSDDWIMDEFVELENCQQMKALQENHELKPNNLFITEEEILQDTNAKGGLVQLNNADSEAESEICENMETCCEICDVSFRTKADYNCHEKLHFTKTTYDCTLCNESFAERVDFAEHFIRCFREAKERGSLNLIEKSCTVCGGYYADEISMKKHMSFHSICRLFPCSFCSFRYYSNKALQKHVNNIHNPRNKFHCPLCDLSFSQSCYLLTHIAVHSGTRPFCCNLCSYKADTKKALKQHFYQHAKNKSRLFKCKECSFVCSGKNILFRHRISMHRDPVKCEICGKVFKKTSGYKRHYEIHTEKSTIIRCQFCLYETPFERYMKKHMHTHPADSPFQCPYCGISISTQHTLGHHMRTFCRLLSPES